MLDTEGTGPLYCAQMNRPSVLSYQSNGTHEGQGSDGEL